MFRRSQRWRSSGRSNFRSRFRNSGRTHEPHRTRRWSRGQFALAPENDIATTADTALTIIPIAQIWNHVVTDTGEDISITNQVRAMEIGGVVFDWTMQARPFYATASSIDFVTTYNQIILVSDRLADDYQPAALSTNWFTNTTPVNIAAAAEVQDDDPKFPTQIHRRIGRILDASTPIVPLGATVDSVKPIFAPNFAQGSVNLRLKLRLDDEHCLAFHFHSAADNTFPSEGVALRTKFWLAGTIYYRTVF